MANSDRVTIPVYTSRAVKLTLEDYANDLGIKHGDKPSSALAVKRLLFRYVPGFEARFLEHQAELATEAVAKEGLDVK